MKRFIVEHVTKKKMYVLFSYLKRGYDLEKPEPFNIEEISKDFLEEANNYAIFRVSDTDSIFRYDLEINDLSIYIVDPLHLILKFELESFNLVLDYTDKIRFEIYLQSKEKDENGFNNYIVFFSDDSYSYVTNVIDIVKIKTYFELYADKKETID